VSLFAIRFHRSCGEASISRAAASASSQFRERIWNIQKSGRQDHVAWTKRFGFFESGKRLVEVTSVHQNLPECGVSHPVFGVLIQELSGDPLGSIELSNCRVSARKHVVNIRRSGSATPQRLSLHDGLTVVLAHEVLDR
jgi:hypothetical protein